MILNRWALSFFFCMLAGFQIEIVHSKIVGCYFGSWAGYRNGNGRFEPENIDVSLCTHIYYSFVGITATGGIRYLDEWNDLPSGKDYIGRFNALKKSNPSLKTLVAIGGWNEGSVVYSQVANSATLRTAFANSAAQFVLQHDFDGFDIDWEYPASRGGAASDYEAYVLLLKEMRSVFDQHGLLLTAAVAAGISYVGTSYNVAEISKYLDYINIMTYDYHGSWDDTTGHNAPLYKSSIDIDISLNVNASVQHWIASGATREKLILGVGTYGRSFTLRSSSNTAIGAPASGPGTAGPYTQESGNLGYNEICSYINAGWKVEWNNDILAPYAHSGNQWVGFDNTKSAKLKAEYAVELGLGGVFIWSLETDDFTGSCGDGKFPILEALNRALYSSDDSEEDTSNGDNHNTTTSVTVTNSYISTTSVTVTNSYTSTTSGSQLCTSSGYVRDPNDCRIFYYCQSSGNGFIAYKFICYGDLVFDEKLNQCTYKDQVPECS